MLNGFQLIGEVIRAARLSERCSSRPDTPNLNLDDLGDLLGNVAQPASTAEIPKRRANKENLSPSKRVRKALHETWSTPGDIAVPGLTSTGFAPLEQEVFILPETPSKSLLGGDSSVLFSPPVHHPGGPGRRAPSKLTLFVYSAQAQAGPARSAHLSHPAHGKHAFVSEAPPVGQVHLKPRSLNL
ncbi:hypothetical protein MRX96_044110 [Rhipicephalus microplus]